MTLISKTATSFAAALLILFSAGAHAQSQSSRDFYEQKVQPIFNNNCARCHVGGGHRAGLKLDDYASVMAGSENGPVIVPGDPDGSTLVRAIRYKNTELQMPPKGKMADEDIATIEKWVKESGKDMTSSTTTTESAAAAQTNGNMMEAAADGKHFFTETVKPILENNCYGCHGAEKQRGGLRVDSREALLKGGRNGAVVVAGDAEHSKLITAVRHTDPELKMPPRRQLTADEVNALVKWVNMGLPWE